MLFHTRVRFCLNSSLFFSRSLFFFFPSVVFLLRSVFDLAILLPSVFPLRYCELHFFAPILKLPLTSLSGCGGRCGPPPLVSSFPPPRSTRFLLSLREFPFALYSLSARHFMCLFPFHTFLLVFGSFFQARVSISSSLVSPRSCVQLCVYFRVPFSPPSFCSFCFLFFLLPFGYSFAI